MAPPLKSAAFAPGRSPTQAAGQALFLLHLTLFIWWGFVQAFVRIAPRFGKVDPTFAFELINFGLIVVSLFVITRLARAVEGTSAQGPARVALVFAAVDVVGQSLQVAPRLGLPALMPASQTLSELGVRAAWVSCEFGLRAATFVALWRSQRGWAPQLALLFFGLVATQWLLSLLSFAGGTTAFAAAVNGLPGWGLGRRAATWLSFSWLAILIALSRRVSRAPS